MSEKSGKHKKGFMSRLSSFRKKKSSSKQGSTVSLQSNSSGSTPSEDSRRNLKGGESVSPTSASLDGLNGRARSTSDLIEKFEKRSSVEKDDHTPSRGQLSKSRTLDANSTFTVVNPRTADKTFDAGALAASPSKPGGHEDNGSVKTPNIKSASKYKGGIRPYQSVFAGDTSIEDRADVSMRSIQEQNADNTTQTEFSTTSEDTDDDVARLVKVQSAKTPEMRRAQLSATADYKKINNTFDGTSGEGTSRQPPVGLLKENFIGPDSLSPLKKTGSSSSQFQPTSTPMPRGSSFFAELDSSHSPIGLTDGNQASSNRTTHSGSVGQSSPLKEVPISQARSGGANERNDSASGGSSSSVSPSKQQGSNNSGGGDVWQRLQPSDSEKCRMGLSSLDQKKKELGLNSTFVKPTESRGSERVERLPAAPVGNHTVILEKGSKGTSAKGPVDRTFLLDSAGCDSLCSDDLMCDSRFSGIDETVFSESQPSSYQSPTRPTVIVGRERSRPGGDLRRKGSADSFSSSLPSTPSVMSSFSDRGRLNSVDKDSMVTVEAATFNAMVRDLAAMKLALLKLNTMLVDAGIMRKTRSSEVQCDAMLNKVSIDTQTEVLEPIGGSYVSTASVQCSLHPPRVSCGSQYEKQKELPKPSRMGATSSIKLAKPAKPARAAQAKETSAATEPCQVSDSNGERSQEQPLISDVSRVSAEHHQVPGEEKTDSVKNGDICRDVEIQVKDPAGVHGSTECDLTQETYLKEGFDDLDTPCQKEVLISKNLAESTETSREDTRTTSDGNNRRKEVCHSALEGGPLVSSVQEGSLQVPDSDLAPLGVPSKVPVPVDSCGQKLNESVEGDVSDGIYQTGSYPVTPTKGAREEGELEEDVRDIKDGELICGAGGRWETDGLQSYKSPPGNGTAPKTLDVDRRNVNVPKASKLQGYKSSNLRYAQKAPAAGSKLAKLVSGRRPPQTTTLELTTHVSTTNTVKQKTVVRSIPQNTHKPGQTLPSSGLRQPSTNKQGASNVAVVKPTLQKVEGNAGAGTQRSPPKNQNCKLQRIQRTNPPSKLSRPVSYTNVLDRGVTAEPMGNARRTASEGKIVDSNGNRASTMSLPDNIMNGSHASGIPQSGGGSRLPKSKAGSRLPRGGGIPKVTRR